MYYNVILFLIIQLVFLNQISIFLLSFSYVSRYDSVIILFYVVLSCICSFVPVICVLIYVYTLVILSSRLVYVCKLYNMT